LVGQNGSGKTNFVHSFSFLAEAMTLPLQAVFDKQGGISVVRNRTSGRSYPPNLGMAVEFGQLNGYAQGGRYAFEIRALPNYGFEVVREQCVIIGKKLERFWFDRNKKSFDTNVKGLRPSLEPSALGLPVVGGDEHFSPAYRTLAGMKVYSIEPAKLREMQDPDSGTSLRSDGGNASSVLQEIERTFPDDMGMIGEILATVVRNTNSVKPLKHGKKLTLSFVQEWGKGKRLKFEAFSMSDGTLRALGMLLAVFQRPAPTFLVVEEPEATIHPGALGAILDLLRHASKKMQVIVTTHSPELLDAKWIRAEHLKVVHWNEGATVVSDVSDATREVLQNHLMGAGELLRSNALRHQEILFDEVRDPHQGDLFEVLH
jgi:predicted ATPase